jgi:hypothetical protein
MKNKASWQTWLIAAMGVMLIGCVVYIFSSDGESGSRVSALSGSGNRGVAVVDGRAQTSGAPAESFSGDQERADAAAVRAADQFTLDAVSGEVSTAGGAQKLSGSEGLFDRVMIGETETVGIRLELPGLKAGQEVVVSASNGGRLERLNGPLRFVPQGDAATLDLKFTSTMGRGAYAVNVRHAGAVATVSLWAGQPLAPGEPGPNFTPLPPQPETIP